MRFEEELRKKVQSFQNDLIRIDSDENAKVMENLRSLVSASKMKRDRVDWITERIALGPAPYRNEELLRSKGVTHLVNLAEEYHPIFKKDLFRGACTITLRDNEPIPEPRITKAVYWIHSMLHESIDSKVYVHCAAGQVRSPCILRLYFTALGMPFDLSTELIEKQRYDAIPDHPSLIDGEALAYAKNLGKKLEAYRKDILNVKMNE